MDVAHPTAGWEQVGDRFYRKIQLYTEVFDTDIDLDNFIVAGAPYGGAIGKSSHFISSGRYQNFNNSKALYRDEDKLVAFQPTKATKPSIDIYNYAGGLIERIPWDKGSVKGLGWSEDEKLLVVTQDGTVRCYYDLQGNFTQFSLGNGADEVSVRSCKYVLQRKPPRPFLVGHPRILTKSTQVLWPWHGCASVQQHFGIRLIV
jgi:WD40 repeat protein